MLASLFVIERRGSAHSLASMKLYAPILVLVLCPALSWAEEDAPPQSRTLALHRVELRPYVGWAPWPDSLTGAFVGGDVGYRLGPVVALELDGALYAPFNAGEAAKPAYPLNETQSSGAFDFVFFPLAGLAGFGSAREGGEAGTLEPFVLGGFGLVRTRPVAVVDPMNRSYDWNNIIDLDVGVGLRAFVTRWLAFDLEVRDLVYGEKRESSIVATGLDVPVGAPGYSANSPTNPTTWYDSSTHLTNAIQVRLGASFFVGP